MLLMLLMLYLTLHVQCMDLFGSFISAFRCAFFQFFAQDSQGECALCLDEYSAGDCVTRLTCFHATGLQWAPVEKNALRT